MDDSPLVHVADGGADLPREEDAVFLSQGEVVGHDLY